jgi:hypothetical protein
MGKFIDTQRRDTVEGVTSFQRSLIDHNLYTFNTQGKGTKVTYYNINKDKSMLDAGSRLAYTDIGEESPIRFNKIKDLYIYQMNRLEVNLEAGEFGMEGNELSGDSYILPVDGLVPTDGDFFTIDYSKQTWLYQVRDASMSSLNDSNQVWKISWVLDRTTHQDILKNVVEEFQYIEPTEGTNTKRIIQSTKYELAKKIDTINESLRLYFKDLFYSDLIQSFTYKWYNEYRMYDPYAIEFIIKNNLLNGKGDSYMFIDHIKKPPVTFGVSYSRSCFRAFELCDKYKLRKYSYQAQANAITDPTTIFATRYDTYFELCYDIIHEPNGPMNPRPIIPIMDEGFVEKILEDSYYDPLVEEYSSYLNIVIKFFNHHDISEKDLHFLDHIDFTPQESLFYNMIFVIYALDYYTNKLLN